MKCIRGCDDNIKMNLNTNRIQNCELHVGSPGFIPNRIENVRFEVTTAVTKEISVSVMRRCAVWYVLTDVSGEPLSSSVHPLHFALSRVVRSMYPSLYPSHILEIQFRIQP